MSGVACANSVIDEWNFMSSGEPKMSWMLRPDVAVTSARAFAQARPEHRVRQIGGGLGARGDGVALRAVARAEAGDLREDEPHPVAALLAGGELGAHLLVDQILRVDEALQIERIGVVGRHGRAYQTPGTRR